MPQMIYVPDWDISKPCVIVTSTYIRVYDLMPQANRQNVPYTDYYHQSSYIYTKSTQNFGNTLNIYCIPNHQITTDFLYRNDIDGILITFAIYSVVMVVIPLSIFKRLFRKR